MIDEDINRKQKNIKDKSGTDSFIPQSKPNMKDKSSKNSFGQPLAIKIGYNSPVPQPKIGITNNLSNSALYGGPAAPNDPTYIKEINQVTRVLPDLQTRIHNDLTNRDAPDVHPISSITGLQGTLTDKVSVNIGTNGQYASAKFTVTVSGGAATIDWNNANVQYVVLENGVNTFTFINPIDGGRYLLFLKQPSGGAAGTVTWPGTAAWSGATPPILTVTNSQIDLVTLVFDGTDTIYCGAANLNYTP